MKIEDLNNAMSHIDYDLVDEFVREKDAIAQRKRIRKNVYRLTPVAACLLIVTLAGTVALTKNLSKSGSSVPEMNQSPDNLEMFLDKDGMFYFEYKGVLYQAYVSPLIDDNTDFAENGSVSIQNVGERISDVTVVDESGNAATMEIYASKGNGESTEILLKLDGGYFKAQGIKQN